jgi:3-methyl-2-oxobutanoate hydroxymethyltransferase
VLVFHDLLGIREGRGGKFVQRYADLQDAMDQGVAAYASDVRSKAYPGPEHEYAMEAAEVTALQTALDDLPAKPL